MAVVSFTDGLPMQRLRTKSHNTCPDRTKNDVRRCKRVAVSKCYLKVQSRSVQFSSLEESCTNA